MTELQQHLFFIIKKSINLTGVKLKLNEKQEFRAK